MFWIQSKSGVKPFPFADVSLDWSGLEKFKWVGKVAKTASLSSGISTKVREGWTDRPSNRTERSYTQSWNPLLGANVSWLGNIDSQIHYNTSSTYTEAFNQGGSKQRQSEKRLTAQVSYTIHTGFRVPLFVMRSIHLTNQTTFSLTADYGTQKQENALSGTNQFSVQGATSSWSLQPRMSYSFSNTVNGQGYLTISQTRDDLKQSKSRTFEFGIQVNIAIRG
jgi:cell surface protein SprA